MKDFKKIAFIVAVCLLVILVVLCREINRRDSKTENNFQKWQNELRNVEVEYRNVEKELEDLEREFYKQVSTGATVQIVFTDLNEKIYSEAYPIMEQYGYVGMLVLSSSQMPGGEGCMTEQQYNKLLRSGWSICIQWEETDDVESWWGNWEQKITSLKSQPTKSVYIPKGMYEVEIDSALEKNGVKNVIVEKEDGENPLQMRSEEGLWHVGAIGCMTMQPKKWMKEAVVQNANIAYLISFTLEDQLYERDTFQRMLDSFSECEKNQELNVFHIEGAREYRENYLDNVDKTVRENYEKEQARLENKKIELENKMEEIDAKYQFR